MCVNTSYGEYQSKIKYFKFTLLFDEYTFFIYFIAIGDVGKKFRIDLLFLSLSIPQAKLNEFLELFSLFDCL